MRTVSCTVYFVTPYIHYSILVYVTDDNVYACVSVPIVEFYVFTVNPINHMIVFLFKGRL